MGKHLAHLLSCAFLAALVLPSAPVSALPRENHGWIEARTEHFVLTGDADVALLRRLAQRLDNLRRVLAGGPGDLDLIPDRSEHIHVFRDWSSSKGYLPDELRGGRVGGTYLGTAFDDRILVIADPEVDPFALICHEYLHLVLRRNFPGLPLWLEEGLAEFYTTFWADDERAEIGAVHDEYLQRLRADGLMPLPELFEVTPDDPVYRGAVSKQRFHAQSWLLVHYLMMARPERRLQLWSTLTRWRDAQGSEPATWDVLDRPAAAMSAALEGYLDTLDLPRFRWTGSAGIDADEGVAIAPLTRAAAATLLGELLIERGVALHKRARKHFELALRLEPDRAAAHAGLGRVALAAGDPDAATARFARAATLEPDEGRYPYLQARSLLQSVWGGRLPVPLSPPPEPDRRIAKARSLLQRAVERLPGSAEVQLRLGYTYLFAPEGATEHGVQALKTARRLEPSRMDAAYYLLVLVLREGSRSEAERLATDVLGRADDPAWTTRATAALARFDLGAADRLARDGRVEEARTLLRDVLARPLGPKLRREVERRLAGVAGGG